jgi:cytochrome c-type protein NapC
MTEPTTSGSRWHALWRVPRSRLLLAVPAGGLLMLVVGIVLWAGFSTSLEATNNEEFCISCHEMRDNVYQEYKETIHNRNRTGVRATCPDCHVPRPWHYKIMRKVQASSEVYHKIMGSIDTREKFVAKRAVLAEREWARMEKSDSRECRNCHDQQSMELEMQDKMARKKHTAEWRAKTGDTCIDCHKGIAHELPDEEEEEVAVAEEAK